MQLKGLAVATYWYGNMDNDERIKMYRERAELRLRSRARQWRKKILAKLRARLWAIEQQRREEEETSRRRLQRRR